MKKSTLVTVKAGKLQFADPGFFACNLSALEGQTIKVTFEEKFSQRSIDQNSYYHGVIIPHVCQGLQDLGFDNYSADFAHSLIKCRFLSEVLYTDEAGDQVIKLGSTTRLSKKAFAVLVEEVICWAAQYLSVQIPFPNEQAE